MWFSTFFENPLVRRVKRRMDIRMVRFWRSTYEVETCARSGGCPRDRFLLRSGADSRAVADFAALVAFAVLLDQHGVVDVIAEGVLNGLQIDLGAVGRELHGGSRVGQQGQR